MLTKRKVTNTGVPGHKTGSEHPFPITFSTLKMLSESGGPYQWKTYISTSTANQVEEVSNTKEEYRSVHANLSKLLSKN